MPQVKVYALREYLTRERNRLSTLIHECIVEALAFPPDKRFHRFFPMSTEDFIYPSDRTDRYTIIEISMFDGRSTEARKRLIRLLIDRISSSLGMSVDDIEITLFETPRHNWGIRGVPGDELRLSYKVES
jgi:phenylpyruvate tautomerase PptA (4-oxalocrotonate tautomerase family)